MSFTPTDEPYTVPKSDIEDIILYKDVPSTKVIHRRAKFFCFTKSINHNIFWYKEDPDDMRPLSMARKGWEKGSPYREVRPLTGDMARWTEHFYSFPPEAIAPHLPDVSVAGARAHWHGDIQATLFGLIVTEKAKALIEELDPGMSYFFPMSLSIQETGDPVGGAHYYWKPRREMRFKMRQPGEITKDVLFKPPSIGGGAFSNAQIAWELKNNSCLRDYVEKLPFWTLWGDNFGFGLSTSVFKRLKSEGLTGLIEIVGEDYWADDFDRNSNVGHF